MQVPSFLESLERCVLYCEFFFSEMKPMFAGKAFPLKLSYDECVLGQYQECRYIPGNNHVAFREGGSHVSQMMFFCGHDQHCQITNGEEALR